MKFGKTLKKNEVVDTDRRWPFLGHLAYCSTDKKKTYSNFYVLVLWDHGFHCGTLKLLEGNL